ncbi:MAG TPA: alpha/beta fold hydrolase [Rhodanobacteraceae bacterium]|nr:alpha/beta fold hydrolase [Rhodanobacteraceae bacterium]
MSDSTQRCRRFVFAGAIALAIVALVWWAVPMLITYPSHTRVGVGPADLPIENVSFFSEPGFMLRGWYIPGRRGAGAILLLHGVRASRLMEIGRARFLHQAGYTVLAFDFRAHGESGGDRITFGYRESRDVAAALAYLKKRAPRERIGVIGTSMGGAAFLLASPPLHVNAVVLEQVYPSIDLALDHRMTRYLGPLGHALSPVLLRWMALNTGMRTEQLRPISHIAKVDAPLLLIGGESDRYTPPRETLAMYAAARQPKQLWLVSGADHVDLQRFAGDEYRRRILAFFNRTLRRTQSEPASPPTAHNRIAHP